MWYMLILLNCYILCDLASDFVCGRLRGEGLSTWWWQTPCPVVTLFTQHSDIIHIISCRTLWQVPHPGVLRVVTWSESSNEKIPYAKICHFVNWTFVIKMAPTDPSWHQRDCLAYIFHAMVGRTGLRSSPGKFPLYAYMYILKYQYWRREINV